MADTDLLAETTGVILAGGLGRRMGGVDKGLQVYAGRPLVAHIIERLRPQVGQLMINANRHSARYAAFGYPVIADLRPDFPGPLAGLHSALQQSRSQYVLTAPCDSPHIPLNLAERLHAALHTAAAPLVYASCEGKAHPVFCLCQRQVLPHLTAYLDRGERRVLAWCSEIGGQAVDFPGQGADFANFNTLEALGTP